MPIDLLPLPHELLLIADGAGQLDESALALAVGGAAIAEPALDGRIAVDGGRVFVIDTTRSSVRTTDRTMRLLEASDRPRRATHWIRLLAESRLVDDVRGELDAMAPGTAAVPPIPDRAAGQARILARMAATLRGARTPDHRTRTLVGLAHACGLLEALAGPQPKPALRAVTDGDPIVHAVRRLMARREAPARV